MSFKKKKNVWMLHRPAPASWSGDSALMLVVYAALMITGTRESFNLDEFGSSAVGKKYMKKIYIKLLSESSAAVHLMASEAGACTKKNKK